MKLNINFQINPNNIYTWTYTQDLCKLLIYFKNCFNILSHVCHEAYIKLAFTGHMKPKLMKLFVFKLLILTEGRSITVYSVSFKAISSKFLPGRPSAIRSMLLDRVGLGLVGAPAGEEDGGLIDLPDGRPGPWLVLESDLTLDGDAGGLSKDFFFSP